MDDLLPDEILASIKKGDFLFDDDNAF